MDLEAIRRREQQASEALLDISCTCVFCSLDEGVNKSRELLEEIIEHDYPAVLAELERREDEA